MSDLIVGKRGGDSRSSGTQRSKADMLLTNTPAVEGYRVSTYQGIVHGCCIEKIDARASLFAEKEID
ncbi:MAG: hypothetical protein ACRC7G_12815, partial [Beijerinckiaceae bacterium]